MEQALQHARIAGADDTFANDVDDHDDLGFVAGLRLAIPIGLAIWALAIWCAIRFFA